MSGSITFSTCFYQFSKSKFDNTQYFIWINNFLSNVNHFNLVVYTDIQSLFYFIQYLNNPRIQLILKPITNFYNYQYREQFERNHLANPFLNTVIDYTINMLWCEKIHFVNETIQNKYFDTESYGWCDIGYFRERTTDMKRHELANWCSPQIVQTLAKDKIHYALIQENVDLVNLVKNCVETKNENGLPCVPIPPNQVSVAGGFFILHRDLAEWWRTEFDRKLRLYFEHNYLVKDDQIIIADCVFSDPDRFILHTESNPKYDVWFLFQRVLC